MIDNIISTDENSKNKVVNVFFSEKEFERISEQAKATCRSKRALCRALVLDALNKTAEVAK